MGYLRFIQLNWLFLSAGFLLTVTSSFGQTYFISLFASQIKADFGLTDGEWGGLYTIGTTASAVAMIWAGALTDRFRVRALALAVMILLALACLAMSVIQGWILLVITIFALRHILQVLLGFPLGLLILLITIGLFLTLQNHGVLVDASLVIPFFRLGLAHLCFRRFSESQIVVNTSQRPFVEL